MRALIARGPTTYRSCERTLALVLGSPVEAASALRRAVSRDVLGLLITAAVLCVHAVAACAIGCALPDRVPFQGMRCSTHAVWDPFPTRSPRP